MLKVLHVIASVSPEHGGPIEGVTRTGDIFREHGVRQEILTLDPPSAAGAFGNPSHVHFLGCERPASGGGPWGWFRRRFIVSPGATRWLRAHVRDYDVVIVNGLWNYATWVARGGLAGSGVPYIVYSHGMLDPWFRRQYPLKHIAKQIVWWLNEGRLIRNASFINFTCEQERLLARKTFVPYSANEFVIAYGTLEPPPASALQTAAFRAATPTLGDRPYLLFLSRIHEKKGCDLLVSAFAKVAQEFPDVDLVIAGPDRDRIGDDLRTSAKRLGFADRIHWPGMLKGDAKWGAYRGSEAFILPSHQENFGIVVAEAAACGRPVLISDQVNIHAEITAGEAGFVAPDTEQGTISLMHRFLSLDRARREMMGGNARKTFQRCFDMRRSAMMLIDQCRTLAGSR